MEVLTLGTLFGGLLLLWWRASLEARAVANRAALEACDRAGVQLLDGTVAFQRLRCARDPAGGLALLRRYAFDYTEDGAGRRHGFVVLRGHEVELVGLGPVLVPGRSAGAA
jgi:Protein of unknown function (DUF3301)